MKQNFQKIKYLLCKNPFFVIGPFALPIPIVLALGSDGAVFYQNMFSILALLTEKHYSSFLKLIFNFSKIWFKVEVLEMFKIFCDCHIKTCQFLKRIVILKIIPSTVFRRPYAFSVDLKKKRFPVLRPKPTQILP